MLCRQHVRDILDLPRKLGVGKKFGSVEGSVVSNDSDFIKWRPTEPLSVPNVEVAVDIVEGFRNVFAPEEVFKYFMLTLFINISIRFFSLPCLPYADT
jgi:hypothetical protein